MRVFLGNAFDLIGERRQTGFFKHPSRDLIRESFEVEVRNRSEEAVRVQVVEHLYRWANWKVESEPGYKKKNARTIEFSLDLAPGAVETIRYTAEYTW